MRKNALIKLLQDIPGNPEVMLWNGLVGDFMQVAGVQEGQLTKQTFANYLELCRLEECDRLRDWTYQHSPEDLKELRTLYQRHVDWEVNQYITDEAIKAKRHTRKRILYVDVKLRGKTAVDRLGSISY